MSDLLDASTVDAGANRQRELISSATLTPQPWSRKGLATRPAPTATPKVAVEMQVSRGVYQVVRIRVTADPGGRGHQGQLSAFVSRLNEFLRTDPDEGADPTSSGVVEAVIENLAVFVLHDLGRVPELFRLADGGILVRWVRESHGTFEIEFDSDGDALAMITDRRSGVPVRRNGDLQEMWSDAMRWLFSA